MNKKALIAMLLVLAAIIVVFAVLYFVYQDTSFILYALLAIGVLNVVNGVIAVKSGMKSPGVIFLAGGIALTVFMLLAIFVLR